MRTKELLLELSYNCNLNCIHCSSIECKDKLNLDQVKEILKDVINDIEYVRISGGEPLLNKDLPCYINWFKENNVRIILQTNGTLIKSLNTELLSNINEFWISLYGGYDIHDFITCNVSYNKTLYFIKNIMEKNKVIIQSPVFNISQMKSLSVQMKELNLPLRLFSLLNHGKCTMALLIEEQIELAELMKDLYKKTVITCSLDKSKCNFENKLVLKPDGKLFNCASHKQNKILCIK